jgi:hypothetical protein
MEKISQLDSQYLLAYLLLKKADYANYQDNLLAHTHFQDQEEFLAKIQSELEDIAYQVRAYQSKDNF